MKIKLSQTLGATKRAALKARQEDELSPKEKALILKIDKGDFHSLPVDVLRPEEDILAMSLVKRRLLRYRKASRRGPECYTTSFPGSLAGLSDVIEIQ